VTPKTKDKVLMNKILMFLYTFNWPTILREGRRMDYYYPRGAAKDKDLQANENRSTQKHHLLKQ